MINICGESDSLRVE